MSKIIFNNKKLKQSAFILVLFLIFFSIFVVGQEEIQQPDVVNEEVVEEVVGDDDEVIEEEIVEEEIYVDLEEIIGEEPESDEDEFVEEIVEEGGVEEVIEEEIGGQEEIQQPDVVNEEVVEEVVGNDDEVIEEEIIYEYIEIEELIEEGNEEVVEAEKIPIEEKIEITLYDPEEINTKTKILENNIEQKETTVEEEDEWKKDVRVYSVEHVYEPITVYTNIIESKIENIKIYWKQEDKYLEFEAFDKNENGLIERISWIVPHLSEQNFEIIIESNIEESENQEIEIIKINTPGILVNSTEIYFDFNISYNNISNIICDYQLKNNEILIRNWSLGSQNISFNENLISGTYDWEIKCLDKNNQDVNNSETGRFYVLDTTPVIDFTVSKNPVKEGEGFIFFYLTL